MLYNYLRQGCALGLFVLCPAAAAASCRVCVCTYQLRASGFCSIQCSAASCTACWYVSVCITSSTGSCVCCPSPENVLCSHHCIIHTACSRFRRLWLASVCVCVSACGLCVAAMLAEAIGADCCLVAGSHLGVCWDGQFCRCCWLALICVYPVSGNGLVDGLMHVTCRQWLHHNTSQHAGRRQSCSPHNQVDHNTTAGFKCYCTSCCCTSCCCCIEHACMHASVI